MESVYKIKVLQIDNAEQTTRPRVTNCVMYSLVFIDVNFSYTSVMKEDIFSSTKLSNEKTTSFFSKN